MWVVVVGGVTSRGVSSSARPEGVCLVSLPPTPLDLDRPAVEWQELHWVDRGSACPEGDTKLDEPMPFITVEILENHLITEFTCVLSQRQLLDNKMFSHL